MNRTLTLTAAPHSPDHATGRDLSLPGVGLTEIFALALLMTVANAFKPLHIDDTAYYAYARQIAEHPLDPYRFTILWYQTWQPAQEVLAPPVLPYWWAMGLRLFGDRPVLWKLWLFPFCFLFVAALQALFKRFAHGLERPLLWMTVLSPAFLPHLNLMLDIPALALMLTALVLFMRSLERSSFLRAVTAGVVAGLAMQTKYTALLAAPVFFWLALTTTPGASQRGRRWRGLALWFVATAMMAGVFVGWESFLVWRHPEDGSHFLYHLHANGSAPWLDRLTTELTTLPGLLGGMAAGIGLLGLVALTARRWVLAVGVAWLVLTYGAVVCLGAQFMAWGHLDVPFRHSALNLGGPFPLEASLFGALGLGMVIVLGIVCVRLFRAHPSSRGPRPWFLIGWLAIEVAGYFVLSPFPAVRRVLGIVIVATLLVGQLASLTCQTPAARRLVWAVAILNMGVGVFYTAVDWSAARASQTAAVQAAAWIKAQGGGGTVWYTGHWGFQFYAEREGMEPLVPGETWLVAGDWLVVPDAGINQQEARLDQRSLERVETVRVASLVPCTTVPRAYGAYYDSGAGAPLLHQDGPQVEVTIYRVRRTHLCR
ncbi:MAG TPA: hypothetical protein VFA18_15990 [Gemmataceae bacterium]|nr:hypothetical protein [Gemmataceae bacterium]